MSAGGSSEIKVPALGESIKEATVARWLKSVGDTVKTDEILVELETDKVTLEVNAPTAGILSEIRVGNGGTVAVGDLLGLISQAGVGTSIKTESPKDNDLKISTLTSGSPLPPKTRPAEPKTESLERLSPSVRKIAEELKINPQDVHGTGKGGRVTKADLLKQSNPLPEIPTPSSDPITAPEHPVRTSDHREVRVKMTRLRQRIAERLKQAQNTAAILTTFNEVDMSAINALRAKYKEAFEKKHGIRLGMMSFFVKACIQALREIPAVNAEIDGDEIIYKNYYDIGVAVSTPQGLVVPIVRNADILSFAELEKSITSLGEKARDGKLSIAEITGGTFTVSNGGIFGSLMSTPILNPPQTGILGMHKMQDRPVAIDGKIEIRPMMYIALSYDHRVIDGRESVTFLVRVKENLENPERLLLDM